MDSRAGGATEAADAGAALSAISGAMTHANEPQTLRYIRRHSKGNEIVAEARSQAPWRKETDGGTG
jgi:hypothetical protein